MTAAVSRVLTGLAVGLALLLVALPTPGPLSEALTSGPTTFTISSSITATLPASTREVACSGPEATLAPGVPRCLTYEVHNHLDVPITVLRITIDLDPAFLPPEGCAAEDLELPAFAGSFLVPAGASATSPGLPIALKNRDFNQDACKDSVLRFLFSGTAVHGGSTQPGTESAPQSSTGSAPPPGSGLDAGPGGGPLAATGASVLALVLLGCALLAVGTVLFVITRRTRAADGGAG